MNRVNQLVGIYHTGFIILLTLGIVFLAAAVFMFWKFDIRRIWTIRTGRAEKKSIREMEEATAMSGRFRTNKPYVPREKSKKLSSAIGAPLEKPVPPNQVGQVVEPPPQKVVIASLSEEIKEGAAATGILKNNGTVIIGTFIIRKTEMLIHTEEVI